jgi:hypothetical protein
MSEWWDATTAGRACFLGKSFGHESLSLKKLFAEPVILPNATGRPMGKSNPASTVRPLKSQHSINSCAGGTLLDAATRQPCGVRSAVAIHFFVSPVLQSAWIKLSNIGGPSERGMWFEGD